MIGNEKGVYVVRSDMARFVPVNIKYNSKDWAIAAETIEGDETLKLYDELIVNGKDLYDGKDVR